MEASFYITENDKVRCTLCQHRCLIGNGKFGICRVRRNIGGTLFAETYGQLSAVHLDPIEKKPLYHFYPGRQILSVGSVGCNLHCSFCQNCDISQVGVMEFDALKEYSVDRLVKEMQLIRGNLGIAFTYNEPAVFFEYMYDVAKATHGMGYKNVMITNGFIEEEPLQNILPFMDAFNVDLKAFTDDFYRKQTHSHLEPVKETLKRLRKENKHLEITNLIIPGLNDSEEEFTSMINWICDELGDQTILHLSRYFPRYQMTKPSTSDSILVRCFEIAHAKLSYVYLGNTNHLQGQNTYCSRCKALIIKRNGYVIDASGITKDGTCNQCGNSVVVNC
jgi:pyruvate formate lyase activating enzyme